MQKTAELLQKDWFIVLLLCILTIPAFSTLFFIGYFPHHDDLQVMRIFEMQKCFADGQIPCRWVPDMGYGYGYPLFNFYPPLPFYVGALIRTVTNLSLLDTVKVLFIIQFLLSTSFMYLFSRQWWGRAGGSLSAMFYTYAPYHAVDLYVRGAVNEAWAMAFVPAIGWALTKLSRKISLGNGILVAVFTACLLLSHNPMTLIFAPLLAIFAVYLVITSQSKALLATLFGCAALAFCLAAFFSLPVLLEQKYVHIDTLYSGYFNYTQHFKSVYKLFFSRYWGYGGSTYIGEDTMAFPIGWLHWASVIAAMAMCIWLASNRQIKKIWLLFIFVGYFWLTAFMMHQKSAPLIWNHLKLLQTLQFPWRLLSTTTFTAAFVVGALAMLPARRVIRYGFICTLIVCVYLLNIGFFHVQRHVSITDADKLSGQLWEAQRTASIFDYLPIYAVAPPGRVAPGNYQIFQGDPTITAVNQRSNALTMNVSTTIESVIRLNILDFPNWQVYLDQKIYPHTHDNYLGLITVQVPPGTHRLAAKFTNTPLRTTANLLSLLAWLSIISWIVWLILHKYTFNKRKETEWK